MEDEPLVVAQTDWIQEGAIALASLGLVGAAGSGGALLAQLLTATYVWIPLVSLLALGLGVMGLMGSTRAPGVPGPWVL